MSAEHHCRCEQNGGHGCDDGHRDFEMRVERSIERAKEISTRRRQRRFEALFPPRGSDLTHVAGEFDRWKR